MNQALVELQNNTNIYPQFHGFVEGWVLTAMLPPEHPAYEQAVEAYYETLDSCAGIRVPRSFPRLGEFGFYILAKKSKSETVCYNTNIAPHNVEGTLYGLGDALVKQGKLRQAKLVYESIRRVPAYPTWPYKDLLDQRLNNMQNLQVKFVRDSVAWMCKSLPCFSNHPSPALAVTPLAAEQSDRTSNCSVPTQR